MTTRNSLPRPTESELEILAVLWNAGSATVRQTQEQLSKRREMGYTTVLKLLQIMHEKGLVKRDESDRTHIYSAAEPRERTQQRIVSNLLDRAFEGSASSLVMRALSSKKASSKELIEIRAMLDEMEGKRK
ncbi:MAG: BlaI/MecI/CopY family transcriptional regulator [Planctomycetes bacterium]|nr:BlaI/MecI/CopY family transcriptional regulator [Planctomycetota bacterium]